MYNCEILYVFNTNIFKPSSALMPQDFLTHITKFYMSAMIKQSKYDNSKDRIMLMTYLGSDHMDL